MKRAFLFVLLSFSIGYFTKDFWSTLAGMFGAVVFLALIRMELIELLELEI